MLRFKFIGLVAALAFTAPANAADTPATRLVNCGAQSCLLVTGHRDDAAAKVSINGHFVAVKGRHQWRARLPVATVRAWSAPYARTVAVAVDGALQHARLPVGMLGQPSDLAMLVVRVK